MTTLNFLKSTQVYASTDVDAANSLGETFKEGGSEFILVQAAANIASAAKKTLVSAVSGSNPAARTHQVNTTTTANDYLVAGVVPSGISTISSTAGQIDSGDIFALQVGGDTTVLSAAAIAAGGLVGTSTTAGSCDDLDVAAAVGAMGVALEAATAAAESIGVRLKGLT